MYFEYVWGRHKVAIEVSEEADCVTILIPEETGNISITYKGKIYETLEVNKFKDMLIQMLADLYDFQRVD